jgi:hypothetical protein
LGVKVLTVLSFLHEPVAEPVDGVRLDAALAQHVRCLAGVGSHGELRQCRGQPSQQEGFAGPGVAGQNLHLLVIKVVEQAFVGVALFGGQTVHGLLKVGGEPRGDTGNQGHGDFPGKGRP